MNAELKNRVLKCISLRHEDSTWDFKREWPHDNLSLLHDILCMANRVERETDGIIIIGIDENSNYSICGVQEDCNRKNTQSITDLLSNVNFAGDNRPEIKVENLKIEEKEVDVIVVKNSDRTPFFLSKDYPDKPQKGLLRAGAVYARVTDTNTPKNKSADYDITMALWEKRFGLDLSEIEKFHRYLRTPEEWDSVDGGKSYYYLQNPRYRLETSWNEEKTRKEYYCYSQLDRQTSWLDIHVICGGTVIKETSGVYMDGLSVAVPGFFMLGYQPFYYYIKNTFQYDLTKFFYSKMVKDASNLYQIQSLEKCIPVFISEEERNEFLIYMRDNQSKFKKIMETIKINREMVPKGEYGDLDYRSYCQAICMVELLKEMRTKVYDQ